MTTLDAILPAAGRISGDFAVEAGTEIKALIPLGGRTVLERTLETLRVTGRVGRVVVIGAGEVASHPGARAAEVVLPPDDSGPANIFRGLEWLYQANGGRHAERVAILTTDLPFVTPQAITDFLDAGPKEADACVPLVTRREFEARFPGAEIDYVRLRDGEWTMGCVFLVEPRALIRIRPAIERAFAARKSQLTMARLLGPLFILRFLARRLTVAHIEERCLKLFGCAGRAVRGCAPELAFDIDLPQDYRYAAARSG